MAEDIVVERRSYCAEHCFLSERAKNSVPRWAFLSALSTAMIIALSFGGWHVSSLRTLNVEIAADQLKNDQQRIIESARFYKVVSDIKDNIQQIKIKQSAISAKQDLVLTKIGLYRAND